MSIAFVFTTLGFSSCTKEDDTSSNPANSRDITYELTGNFSGSVYVSYTTASGGTFNESVTIPWSKSITYATTVDAAIISINGSGGIAGQTVTIIVKQGGTPRSSNTSTAAGSAGSFSPLSSPVITF